MTGLARRARGELPNQPTPATLQHVKTAIAQLPDDSLRKELTVILALAWMTTARVGCVNQLDASDVTIPTDGSLSVRFLRGKGVLSRGQAYTVPPQGTLPIITQLLAARNGRRLFPNTLGTKVKEALRRAHPTLEQRSLRRGSLQHLSTVPGMTDSLLLLFSGHARIETLRRYLSWGTAAHHTRQMMQPMGAALAAPANH
jgi:hypothetical protein